MFQSAQMASINPLTYFKNLHFAAPLKETSYFFSAKFSTILRTFGWHQMKHIAIRAYMAATLVFLYNPFFLMSAWIFGY